ncbi:MAG: hypothetical protein JNK02_15805 [Planctomycetes bacterium]|nr:hypothetical protein [Planctomycetota bacterium]
MFAAALLALAAQEVPPPLPPLPDARPAAAPVLDVDGAPVEPGRLPASTAPEARAAWERLAAAIAAGATSREPVTGFDLQLDLRLRVRENQSNDFPGARYAYLAPSWLLADTGKGRRQVRGPRGDWLYDATVPTERALVRLDVGRENAEDRRQLDEALVVARLFSLLVDARNVRIVRLVPAENPQTLLPAKAAQAARALSWFELETPDVRPGAGNPRGARILLGLAADSGLPALALSDDAAAPRRVNPTTAAIALSDWRAFDGRLLPRKVLVHLPRIVEVRGAGESSSRVADGWRAEPAMDLVVKSGTLSAPLTPEDFLPPAPR